MKKKLTIAEKKALKWLHEKKAPAFVDRSGRFVAAGEVASFTTSAAWLRLIAKGWVKQGQYGESFTVNEYRVGFKEVIG